MFVAKDGGPESRVTGYWLVEWKWLFSIVLLKFEHGSREAFHSHAFNSVSWLIRGMLVECFPDQELNTYFPSLWPIFTRRETVHKVYSFGTSWVLSFRGPWAKTWYEIVDNDKIILGHGRVTC